MNNLVSVFSTVVLVTSIATLILALVAYLSYKIREWRKPRTAGNGVAGVAQVSGPIFLKRYIPETEATDEFADHAK